MSTKTASAIHGARKRRGFTLLELIMALVLTAIAVTMASAALRTATVARERVAAHRDTMERDVRFRAMLTDMLRHPPSAESVDEPLLSILSTQNPAAKGSGRLVFLSKGVRAPYGTGTTFRVTLDVVNDGLVLEAEPIGASGDRTTLRTLLPGVSALTVRVLEARVGQTTGAAASSGGWRTDWPLAQMRPAAIALNLAATEPRPPLVVALDPLSQVAVRQ